MKVFILAEIQAEIRDKWVPHPFCPSTIGTMLNLIGLNIGPNLKLIGVGTCEQAFMQCKRNINEIRDIKMFS